MVEGLGSSLGCRGSCKGPVAQNQDACELELV